jgi:hypothetical protein
MTDITITKGSTFSRVLRWEAAPFVYTPITAISNAAPALVTAAGHGLVDGWRAAVLSPGGMRQIAAKNAPPTARDFHKVTFVSSSQISFNDIDSSGFTTYTSGGFLCSYTPVPLAGFSARMQIRATAEAANPPLVSLVSPTDIVLDDANHIITVTITAAATAALTFSSGVYDLELVSGDATPVVTKLLSGSVFVVDEVTR